MAGYRKGTQEWYDKLRQIVVDTGKKLQDDTLSESSRRSIGREHISAIEKLAACDPENFVNNPLNLD